MKRYIAVLLAIVGVIFLLSACNKQMPHYPKRQAPAGLFKSTAAIAAGHKLFEAHCTSCHGTLEEGRMPNIAHFSPEPPSFLETRYQRLDPAFLFWRIAKGKTVEPYLSEGSVMPAWGGYFSDQQIWDLVAYLKNRSQAGS